MQSFKSMISTKSIRAFGYSCLFLVQLISASILTGGISNEAQYGPANICLLYITNYHMEVSSYVFSARSSECTNLIALGSFAIVLTLFMAALFFYFYIGDKTRPSHLTLAIAILSTIFTCICLVGAGTASAGLSQTCSQFEGLTGGECASVFSTGFLFDNDASTTYSKNLGTVVAAVNSSWIMVIGWILYSGLEWYNWRVENSKWW